MHRLQHRPTVNQIYGWLRLSQEAHDPTFKLDYRSDVRTVFLRTDKELIKSVITTDELRWFSPLHPLYPTGIREVNKYDLPTW